MDGFKATWGDDDGDEKREPFFWWGIVSNNKDPENRGRCKITIPGMNHTESAWAEQCGSPGGGGGKHGVWAVPKKGATVIVGFIMGDIDTPFYLPGPAPINGAADLSFPNPTAAPVQNPASPDDYVFETDDFRFSLVQKEGAKRARLETLLPTIAADKQDQVRSIIEININEGSGGKSHMINIIAPSGINIESQGTININAGVLLLKGRTVMPSGEAI